MFTVFSRAAAGLALSPTERAVLRFLEVLIGGALLSGVQAAAPVLATQSLASIDWASVGHTFLAAFVLALYAAYLKFNRAHGDAPLTPPVATSAPVAAAVAAPVAAPALAVAPAPLPSPSPSPVAEPDAV